MYVNLVIYVQLYFNITKCYGNVMLYDIKLLALRRCFFLIVVYRSDHLWHIIATQIQENFFLGH